MASPVGMYVIPKIGIGRLLEIPTLDAIKVSTNGNSPSRRARRSAKDCHEYTIHVKTFEGLPLKSSSPSSFIGICSPTNPITLPRIIKRNAGILEEAAHYAFIHPPGNLAQAIDWSDFESGKLEDSYKSLELVRLKTRKLKEMNNIWAIPYFSLLGGFIYFDADFNIIAVNALTRHETPYSIKLAGPFRPLEKAAKEIRRAGRAQPLVLKSFFEVGYVAGAWIHPKEKFQHAQVAKEFNNNHGSFMFFKEDGSAVLFCIDPSGFIDPEGEKNAIVDAFNAVVGFFDSKSPSDIRRPSKYMAEIDQTRLNFRSQTENNQLRLAIESIRNSANKHDFLNEIGDIKTLIHEAVKTDCDYGTIRRHLDETEIANLEHRDGSGRTPLHYACSRRTQDLTLIQFLIEKCPGSITILDQFDRCPLHIACNNNASVEIISALIDADPDRKAIYQKTRYLQRLPIHIALHTKLSKDAIEYLLHADPSSNTLISATKAGRYPLHIAVEQKLCTEVIKMLLETNSKDQFERRHQSDHEIEISFSSLHASNGRKAIRHAFEGMIPLHIACWNNSSEETIKALLDADYENDTIDREVGEDSFLFVDTRVKDILGDCGSQPKSLKDNKTPSSSSFSVSTDFERDVERCESYSGESRRNIRALHIAAKNGSPEVIHLILQKEKERRQVAEDEKDRHESVLMRDINGKTPLHICCSSSNNPAIIYDLLEMDIDGLTTVMIDENELAPIHYACDRRDANEEIIKMLLKAEENNIALKKETEPHEKIKRSTHLLDDRKRSPLYLAVKAGANEKVISLLLESEQFFLKGFDKEVVSRLSSMAVENWDIQNCIIDKLTERCYFSLLFLDVYTNAFALYFFIAASEKLKKGEITLQEPLVISMCIVIFVLRQTIQLKSQPAQFFAGFWNYVNVASITLLGLSTRHMMNEVGSEDVVIKQRLLITTGAFLIMQTTFFLRATFLPFARFVGGLVTIFTTLVPFFVVASLMLLAFAYGFFIQGAGECSNLVECYVFTLQGFFSGFDDTDDILDILFGLIAIVVLLNVVIAIVSEAWDEAKDKAITLFWKFRLEFLCEARFYAYMDKKLCHNGIIDKWGDQFDNLKGVKFADDTPWADAPYNLVSSKQQYDHPYDYFHDETAAKISNTKSLQGDIYWSKMDIRMENKENHKQISKAKKKTIYLFLVLRWLVVVLGYSLLCVGGLCTAGWLWPKGLRRKVLAVGLKSKEEMMKKQTKANGKAQADVHPHKEKLE